MSLLDNFITLRDKMLEAADTYEKCQSYEMAYIALWSVTEHTVKAVEKRRKNKELRKQVLAWYKFFEDNSVTQRPRPITSFVCEVKQIPEIKLIKESLGEAPALEKLLQTKKKGVSSKYRDKRNAIAHSAEKFKDGATYRDYKETALAAIEELEQRLSHKGDNNG